MRFSLKIKPGVPMEMDAGDTPTFEAWMARVDRVVSKSVGLSVSDLPDCPFRDWFDDRVRPVRAAKRAVSMAGADA